MSEKVWRGAFALLFAFVTYMTLTPDPDDARSGLEFARWLAALLFHDAAFGDKIAHFLAYGALGLAAAFANLRAGGRRAALILLLASYGGALEFLQGLGGVRVAEFADGFANASGALAGYFGAVLIERAMARLKPA